ncbi:MAG: replication protein [Alicyclobacillus sp.]|nr:replication protein [Alicyclobacillus sp.]
MPKGDYQRLKADIEDGVVPVAHLLLEATAMANLHGVAKGVLMFIWRRTYGWMDANGSKHKTDRITLEEFARAVNSERTYVSKQLKALIKANVITESTDGRYKRYGMNTDIALWSDEVLDKDKLMAAIDSKLYIHSSRQPLSYNTTIVPQNNVQPLSSETTVVLQNNNHHEGTLSSSATVDLQDNCPTEQPLSSRSTQRLSSRTTFMTEEAAPRLGFGGAEIKKEINKKIDDDGTRTREADLTKDYLTPIKVYAHQLYPATGIADSIVYDMAEMLFKANLPVDIAYAALDVTHSLSKDEGFAKNKVRRWLQQGVKTAEEARALDEQVFGNRELHMDSLPRNIHQLRAGPAITQGLTEDELAFLEVQKNARASGRGG